jgi:antitoxin MazE
MDSKAENKGENREKNKGEVTMTAATTVQRWGNSLAVRIPKDIAEKVQIDQGTEMEWQVQGKEGIISLVPKKTKKVYTLEELLAQCTPERAHEELDFGVEGNELI